MTPTVEINRVVVAICPACDELGLLRYPGAKCWMCGGWVGHEYPISLALLASDLIRGWGFGFYGSPS